MCQVISNCFVGCEVLICDFHREQAWGRWLKATKNGCSGRKGDILPRLRRIARSQTVEEMNEAIISLRNSEFWEKDQFSNLREYIENYWLEIKEVCKDHNLNKFVKSLLVFIIHYFLCVHRK